MNIAISYVLPMCQHIQQDQLGNLTSVQVPELLSEVQGLGSLILYHPQESRSPGGFQRIKPWTHDGTRSNLETSWGGVARGQATYILNMPTRFLEDDMLQYSMRRRRSVPDMYSVKKLDGSYHLGCEGRELEEARENPSKRGNVYNTEVLLGVQKENENNARNVLLGSL
ncbi:hypothetical protein BDN71DRAFT_1434210 [Pleurotus eryngii]|uniref:Uncharacterized protein n=1 Tax=Pleurotus eryngii TaxID=5323 RepID=A0A9P5ZSK1_PLEER|nr:hypothetical protein BDN71DRAFT_1434210 [Pleurotus eryngii]